MSAQTKRSLPSAPDRFSFLPDEVTENILTFVSLQEAAQTSVLSKRWRFTWRNIQEIIFDDSFYNDALGFDEDDLISIIDQVLLLHTGSIFKFKLSLRYLKRHDYVDRVIYSILRKGIKDFTYSRPQDLYKLPISLFSCEQLKHLNLCLCIIKLPSGFKGLPKLVSLELRRVFIYEKVCSSIISKCPLLEKLIVKDLAFCEKIEIMAPNLKIFQCGVTLSLICFKNTPHLESLSIILNRIKDKRAPEPVVIYDNLTALEFLELDDLSFRCLVQALADGERNKNGSELNHLKVMKLHDISFNFIDEVSVTVYPLLGFSKKLEKLTITIRKENLHATWQNMGISKMGSFNHLREVKIWNVYGTRQELEFIEYILANAPKLLNMEIVPCTLCDEHMHLMMLTKVIKFRRESRLAQITFN